jgi:hypothetical protein
MKLKAAMISENGAEELKFTDFLRSATREMTTLHRANIVSDAEIRRLQISTRKKLDRIQEILRHVQADN